MTRNCVSMTVDLMSALGQLQSFPAANIRRLNGWKATVTGRSLL
jgi:hypothetical protein